MPHISPYDLALDSEDEEFIEDSEEEKMRKRKMLVDEILEEYDAKLEQEKLRKLEEERLEKEPSLHNAKSTGPVNLLEKPQKPQSEASEDTIFAPDLSSMETFKPFKTESKPWFQNVPQIKTAVMTSRNTFVMQDNFASKLKKKSPESNGKVFVRISDCAQPAAPIRVRIREGSVTELEPEEPEVAAADDKVKTTLTPKPAALGKLEDSFNMLNDLPSDLLPGLYDLPNLGFNEGPSTSTSNASVDRKESSAILKTSQTVYERHIHAYSKKLERTERDVNSNVADSQKRTFDQLDTAVKLGVANCNLSDEVKVAGGGVKNQETEEDDGSYVVLVIPKHATVDDVMRVLRKAGKQPASSKEIHKIITKRKSSNRSPRKTPTKKRRQEEMISPIVIEEEKPSIKQEPKSDLDASCTLAAMSMLAAVEKGIADTPTISNDTDVSIVKQEPVEPECEVITIEDGVDELASLPASQLWPEIDGVEQQGYDNSEQHPNPDHIEFGLFNDHTYANLQLRQAVQNMIVPMMEPVPVPDAAMVVTIKTEIKEEEEEVMDTVEVKEEIEVKEVVKVKKEVDIKGAIEKEVKEEMEEEEVEDQEVEEEAEEEAADDGAMNDAENPSDDAFGDAGCGDDRPFRRSRRLSQKSTVKWSPNNPSNRRSKKVELKDESKDKPPVKKKDTKTCDVVKWQLFPAKFRCRLCEVMCRPLSEMKQHIVEVHCNQKRGKVGKQKMTGGKVGPSDALSDFEVSALSAIVRLCPTCDKYVPETRISSHLENHASLKVVCEICRAAFKNRTKLSIHKEVCQSVGTLFKCRECCKEYSSRSSLGVHQRYDHQDGQRKKRYCCERCDKVCRSAGALKVHIAIHFTLKPFECADCGKGFSQKINLEYHKRVHTGDSSFKCDMCQEAFAQNVSLKTHKKKKHGMDMLKKRKL